ncbi:MAG TPA: insulinase family protein [Deltaproteobacteria bacterium]|nr:insulinase family protein [Deltaproteobacteria bacterium]
MEESDSAEKQRLEPGRRISKIRGPLLYQKTTLENGIRIVTEKIPHLHSVSVGVWVDAGSRDEEPSESGITHFIEHMLFKGTEKRSALQIAKEFDAIGGLSNAFTSKEHTCFHAKVIDYHLPLVIDILSDIFLNSKFDKEEMDRERAVILQEICMVEDTPDDYIHILLSEHFWGNHSLARPIYGYRETVQSFDKDKILRYMKKHYHPGRIVIAAAGNVEHENLIKLVEDSFGNLAKNPNSYKRIKPQPQPNVYCTTKELEQTHLCIATQTCSLKNQERYLCGVFNIILGGSMSSRLFQEVREKRGLAYSVYSFVSMHSDTGMLGIYAGVQKDKLNAALEAIRGTIIELKSKPVNDEELKLAKDHIKGNMYLNAESSDSRMSRLAKNEILYNRLVSFEEIEENLEAVTAKGIQQWVNSVFKAESLALEVLGPINKTDIKVDIRKI